MYVCQARLKSQRNSMDSWAYNMNTYINILKFTHAHAYAHKNMQARLKAKRNSKKLMSKLTERSNNDTAHINRHDSTDSVQTDMTRDRQTDNPVCDSEDLEVTLEEVDEATAKVGGGASSPEVNGGWTKVDGVWMRVNEMAGRATSVNGRCMDTSLYVNGGSVAPGKGGRSRLDANRRILEVCVMCICLCDLSGLVKRVVGTSSMLSCHIVCMHVRVCVYVYIYIYMIYMAL